MSTTPQSTKAGETRAEARQRMKDWLAWMETDEAKEIYRRQYAEMIQVFEAWRKRR